MLKDFYPSISADAMRKCAIDYQWFTSATNAQYSEWLDMAGWRHKITPAWLYKVAKMAVEHSNMKKLGYEGEDKENIINNFSAILLNYASIDYTCDYH